MDEEKIPVKFRTTIILFAVFLVLLIVVLLFEYKGKGEKDEEEKLLALSSDDVRRYLSKKRTKHSPFRKMKKENGSSLNPWKQKLTSLRLTASLMISQTLK